MNLKLTHISNAFEDLSETLDLIYKRFPFSCQHDKNFRNTASSAELDTKIYPVVTKDSD